MPELRKDPITSRWVIISTERAKRPKDFEVIPYEKKGGFCPFCPGNEDKTPREVLAFRLNGSQRDTPGWSVRVVPNKFPALRIEGDMSKAGEGMFDKMSGIGAHEVIVETPDHFANLSDLSERNIEEILMAYRDRILDLRKDSRFRYIMIFKNQGGSAGASMEHPHSQLIALPILPKRVMEELQGSLDYYNYKDRCVFCDIVRQELSDGLRVVMETPHFLALAPYAPRFPFETWIIPKVHCSSYEDSRTFEYKDLANVLLTILKKLDIALKNPPYNYIIHKAPIYQREISYYHWHLEIMPRVSRVAGFEWGSGFYINPTPPEESAKYLRELEL